jgi:hypothetical protein
MKTYWTNQKVETGRVDKKICFNYDVYKRHIFETKKQIGWN